MLNRLVRTVSVSEGKVQHLTSLILRKCSCTTKLDSWAQFSTVSSLRYSRCRNASTAGCASLRSRQPKPGLLTTPGRKPQETTLQPHHHARRPRALRKRACAASRACFVISQWAVASNHVTRVTNVWRPRSGLLVAKWPQLPLVCAAWLYPGRQWWKPQTWPRLLDAPVEGLLRLLPSLWRDPRWWPPHPCAFKAWTWASEHPQPGGLRFLWD